MRKTIHKIGQQALPFVGFIAVLLIGVSLTACGKKGKSGTTATTPGITSPGLGVYPGCQGCSAYQGKIASGMTVTSRQGIEIGLSLYGQTGQLQNNYNYANQNVNYNYGGAFRNYEGPVTALGYMFVPYFGDYDCPLRQGLHRLQVIGPNGDYSREAAFEVRDLSLQAIAPDNTIAQLTIDYGEFYEFGAARGKDNFDYTNGFWGKVVIETVAGKSCGTGSFPYVLNFPRQ